MNFLKRNYGWMIGAVPAALPLFVIFSMVQIDLTQGFSIILVEGAGEKGRTSL